MDRQAYFDFVVWLDHQACHYRRNRMMKELAVIEEVRSQLSKAMDASNRRRKGWDK